MHTTLTFGGNFPKTGKLVDFWGTDVSLKTMWHFSYSWAFPVLPPWLLSATSEAQRQEHCTGIANARFNRCRRTDSWSIFSTVLSWIWNVYHFHSKLRLLTLDISIALPGFMSWIWQIWVQLTNIFPFATCETRELYVTYLTDGLKLCTDTVISGTGVLIYASNWTNPNVQKKWFTP